MHGLPGSRLQKIAEPAPAAWRTEIEMLTTEIYHAVGYRGLGSIEYKWAQDGRLVIMEPTVGRTNYQNEVAVLNGVNLPAIAYYDGMGMTQELARILDRAAHKHRATKLIDLPADFRSARYYVTASNLTWREWLRSKRGPKHDMLLRLNDPVPALLSAARAIASFTKHRILKPILRPLLALR